MSVQFLLSARFSESEAVERERTRRDDSTRRDSLLLPSLFPISTWNCARYAIISCPIFSEESGEPNRFWFMLRLALPSLSCLLRSVFVPPSNHNPQVKMTEIKKANHYIFSVYPLNGHARPLTSIACNLLSLHPHLHITLLVNPLALPLVEKVVAEHELSEEEGGRLKIVACLVNRIGFSLDGVWDDLDAGIKGSTVNTYTSLLRGDTFLWDRGRGALVEGLCGLKPDLIVCDMFLFFTYKMLETAKKKTDFTSTLPLYVFLPGPAGSYINHFAGPPAGGPIPLMRPQTLAALREAKTFGDDVDDDQVAFSPEFEAIAIGMYMSAMSGRLVSCPGVPDMFDYEYSPQATALPIPDSGGRYLAFCAHQVLTAASGCILPWSSSVLEPGTVEAAGKLVPGKEVFAVGAQGPSSFWEGKGKPREAMSEGDLEVMTFLDEVEKKKGGKRALYISFGSVWFPLHRPDLIVHLIETLLDLPEDQAIPFVFALASPLAHLTDEIKERIKASGRGLLSSFAPQYEVLTHPATGWFLTHAGSNSVSESLVCGVPMICWPSVADQPGIAAQVTLGLDAAFELLQIRTPPPFLLPLPTARGVTITGTPEAIVNEMKDVFARLGGEEGERKRANALKLSEEMKKDRIGGEAREVMMRLGRVGLD